MLFPSTTVTKRPWDPEQCRRAIHLVEMIARSGRYIILPGAETSMSSLGHDKTDIEDCLTAIREDEVSKFEKDRDFDDRHILEIEHRTEVGTIYVKVSLRIDKDHDLLIRSYHRSGM